jgi:hypothetical protein
MDFPLFTDRTAWQSAVDALRPKFSLSLEERERENRRILGLWLNSAGVNVFMSSTKDLPTLTLYTTSLAVAQGIHAIRSILASDWEQARDLLSTKTYNTKRFRQYGYFAVYNVFGSDIAAKVVKELHSLPISVHKTPDNSISNLSECWCALTNESPIRQAVFSCLGLDPSHPEAHEKYILNTFGQKVRNAPNDGDIQKHFHTDTFFPALKFWYFPEEVTLADGPLRYVPASHHLTEHRLVYMQTEYEKLTLGKPINPEFDYGHMDGSLRISEEDILSGPYQPIMDMTVPADTLIVANVFGWHARGEATRKADRVALHGSIRLNNPLGT